ncbi:tyrosine-type recombinase/integrase [Flavobacterium silvaticum]|uniref:Tyrosine-type recombinase/integrase n=1 Tax=Flavobacterium silvaticum TaxID=1852020 RepID=A0A972FUW3_9FLAO|nr:tyrosine-type recombinase/integrase [Flavobacterium silvaticum]NMH28055.1 tyrosine-type recombinase/integrase [Flavobacterium silvaticum]
MSGKLKKPKFTGMKIYCNTCKRDNPTCKHHDSHVYRVRLHVKGSTKGVKVKTLLSRDYDEAVDEAIAFKKEMVSVNYQPEYKPKERTSTVQTIQTLVSGILKYDQYLNGKHELVHLRKEVGDAHRKETIRFCTYFCDAVKKIDNVTLLPISEISQHHVAAFYSWAEKEYAPRTFNKMMAAMKGFFDFIVAVEKIKMENPFAVYVTKEVGKQNIQTLSKTEFEAVLEAVDNASPIFNMKTGEKKTMFYPYLKNAFKLFLLTGGRREEVVDLKWSDLMITVQDVRFFQVANGKVEKQKRSKNLHGATANKFFPVNADLMELLTELGYEEFKGQDKFIIAPERTVSSKTIMDRVSKAFTHYRKEAGITKEVSLDELRKTYLTWMNTIMNKDTKILSSHSNQEVLNNHYIDPTVLSAVEKANLEFRIFAS